ncbi:MAG: hypothetical protein M1816_001071 [Peltula sp. TS41687]|nr:MAG: hypothetical protein M1816_001071 [Peltula sp. TS41687]
MSHAIDFGTEQADGATTRGLRMHSHPTVSNQFAQFWDIVGLYWGAISMLVRDALMSIWRPKLQATNNSRQIRHTSSSMSWTFAGLIIHWALLDLLTASWRLDAGVIVTLFRPLYCTHMRKVRSFMVDKTMSRSDDSAFDLVLRGLRTSLGT